jgi:hypothetical protein
MYGVGGMVYSFAAKAGDRAPGRIWPSPCGWLPAVPAWSLLALVAHRQVVLPVCILAGVGYYMRYNTLTTHATQMAHEVRGTAVDLRASALFIGISADVALNGPRRGPHWPSAAVPRLRRGLGPARHCFAFSLRRRCGSAAALKAG